MSRFCMVPTRAVEDSRLSMTHLRVLLAIGQHTDKNGWAFPSLGKIAKRIGVTRQRVSKCVSDFKEWGYVVSFAQMRNDGSGQTSNLYRVCYDVGGPVDGHLFQDFDDEICQSEVAPPQSIVAPPQSPEVAPPATSRGCTINVPVNVPVKKPTPAQRDTERAGQSPETTDNNLAPNQQKADTRADVVMSAEWVPSSAFGSYLKMAMVPAEKFTDFALMKFRLHHIGKTRKQNEWEVALINWIKGEAESATPTAIVPKKRKSRHLNLDQQEHTTGSF